MPLQNIPQQNQPVGLQLLGDALMGGAADYANKRRQDEMMAKQRAERLADVSSARGYEAQQFDKLRGLQLSDEQRKRGESFDDAKRRAEYERRLAMLTEAGRLGLFDVKLLGDVVAEEAALAALQQHQGKATAFAKLQQDNAVSDQAELGRTEQGIRAQLSELNRRLSTPAKVDMKLVAARAFGIATQQNEGKMPTRAQIEEAKTAAYETAAREAMIQDYQEKEAARVEQQNLIYQLGNIQKLQATNTTSFGVSRGAVSPLVDAQVPPPQATKPPGVDPMAGFTEAMEKTLAEKNIGQGRGTAGARSSLQDIQSITAARATAPAELIPMLDQSKTAMLADAYKPFDDAVFGADAKLAEVNKKISLLQLGRNPMQGVDQSTLSIPAETQGEWLANLFRQRAAFESELAKSRQARTAGKTALLSGIRPVSPLSFGPTATPTPGLIPSGP